MKVRWDLSRYLRCKRYLSRRYQDVWVHMRRYFLLSGVATDRDRLGATRGYWPFALLGTLARSLGGSRSDNANTSQ